MVLAAMLDRAHDADDMPLFLIKGGVAMELRFALDARATKDLDLACRTEPAAMITSLDEALHAGHGDFTARRTAIEPIRDTGAHRTTIKLSYRGRPWASVTTDLAPTEPGIGDDIDRLPAKPLSHLGLDGPADIPCIAVHWQIAQKLHACTERFAADHANERYRDLIDIILLWGLTNDPTITRRACTRIFEHRQAHPWPPTVQPPPDWADPYLSLARDIGFPISELEHAVVTVDNIITTIDRSR